MYKNKEDMRAYGKQWYEKNKKRRIAINYAWRAKNKKEFISFKKTLKCNSCGEKDIRCLDFHHIDPSKKDFTVGAMHHFYSFKRIKKEIEKCEVLCSNCHRKFHSRD